jgi:hypothetical protein
MQATLGLAFEIAGRLVAITVLGFSILRGNGAPLLFLWGLWIEEVLSLVGLSVRQALLRRPPLPGLYFAFPAVHLIFVLCFSLAGVTGMFSDPSAPRLAAPPVRNVLILAGVYSIWTMVDLVRAVLRRRSPGQDDGEKGRIDREAWLSLFLPHITIIAGGFCLVMLKLGNWMAWGILAGKVLFEALSFAIARGGSDETPTESGSKTTEGRRASLDGRQAPPADSAYRFRSRHLMK